MTIGPLEFEGGDTLRVVCSAVYFGVPLLVLAVWRLRPQGWRLLRGVTWGWIVFVGVMLCLPVTDTLFERLAVGVGAACIGTGMYWISRGKPDGPDAIVETEPAR